MLSTASDIATKAPSSPQMLVGALDMDNPAKTSNLKTKLLTVMALKERTNYFVTIVLALIVLGSSGVIAYLATKPEECKEYLFVDASGQPNISKMITSFEKTGFQPEHLQIYYDSFSPGPTPPVNTSGTSIGVPISGPTHGPASGRRLGTLGALVAIGKDIGKVWSIVAKSAVVSVNTANWVGAVPKSYASNWGAITGWKAHTAKPWGSYTPNCNSDWGKTQVDWSLSYEANGQYIENAKIIASAQAAWGMTVDVSVTPSTVPVNVGTVAQPIAQLQFEIKFSSKGGWSGVYLQDIVLTFDATGNYKVTSNTGSFC